MVWLNGDRLVRALLKKKILKTNDEGLLKDSIFWHTELPTVARYPPQEGLRILNEEPETRCRHLMPFIHARIEELGLVEDWRRVGTFSCVDLSEKQTELVEFRRPGDNIPDNCDLEKNKVFTMRQYSECASHGNLDLKQLEDIIRQLPPRKVSCEDQRLVVLRRKYNAGVLWMASDIGLMMRSSLASEIVLATLCPRVPRHVRRDAEAAFEKVLQRNETIPLLFEAAEMAATYGAATSKLAAIGVQRPELVVPMLREACGTASRAAAARTLRKMGPKAAAAVPELRQAETVDTSFG